MYVKSVKNKTLTVNNGSHGDKNVDIIGQRDAAMLCTVHNTLVHETHHYTPQWLDTFGMDTSILHISVHTTM
jgi:hypothetical protein